MKKLQNLLIPAMMLAMTSPAYAQFDGGKTLLTTAMGWVKGAGVALVTIALMFVGFRMVFQAAEWKDVAPVFWGGIIIGGAAGIVSFFGIS